MFKKITFLALCASALASPVLPRKVDKLNQAAFEEAQQRDDTATRALSNVQIKTSDGKCLFVDELSGDFRANLTPVQIADCGSTDGQGWDIITAGKHNDQKGQMLVVSTLTQACLNFDPRRAAGTQANLFSCGGRADGEGQVVNSQLFAFDGGSGPFSLKPQNGAGMCLTGTNAAIDVAACKDGESNQTFTFGTAGAAGATSAAASASASNSTAPAATSDAASAVSSAAASASTPATEAPKYPANNTMKHDAKPMKPAKTMMKPAKTTIEHAKAAMEPAKTMMKPAKATMAGNPGKMPNVPGMMQNQEAPTCAGKTVTVTNVMTVTMTPGEGALPPGTYHPDSSTKVAAAAAPSAEQPQDAGNYVYKTVEAPAVKATEAATKADSAVASSADASTVAATEASSAAASTAKVSKPAGIYTNTTLATTVASTTATLDTTSVADTTVADTTSVAAISTAANNTTALVQTTAAPSSPPAQATGAVPVSRAGGTLNPEAAAEANAFDATAKRPVESVNIRAADGRCLFIDPTAGDFRENLIPVQMAKCSEDASQKFDIVTSGKHNDGKAKEALLVSVLMNGCLSFDGRRAVGDTVTMFSCGGRADGEGQTDSAQLYPFDGSNNIVLEPASGNTKTCLVAGKDRLESAACSQDKSQTFEIVEVL